MAEAGASRARDELAANLNALCQGAVQAAASGSEQREAYVGRLLAQARELRGCGDDGETVADFVEALAELLSGRRLEAAIVGLVEPFRQGLRAVAMDIEAAIHPAGTEDGAGSDATHADEADPQDPSDWVAALAAQTVSLLRSRDREAAGELAAELDRIRSQPGIDPDASAYMSVITGVLSGADVRMPALRLAQPYRDAYFSMQKLMQGGDPRAALLERVTHNAGLVLRDGGEEARIGLGDVLEDLRRRAQARDAGELADFVEAVGRLVDADRGFDPAATAFEDEDLQASWLRIRQAWSTNLPR